MADNFLYNEFSTPKTFASQTDASGVHYQKVILSGPSGSEIYNLTYGYPVDVKRLSGSVAVTGTFWQATQPVSGPLTNTELRSSYIPTSGIVTNFPATQAVTGTFWQTTQPVSVAATVATSGVITNFPATQAVTGTFWQATQPVSGPLTDTELRASAVATISSRPSSSSITSVSNAMSSTQLLASNANRIGASIFNDDTAASLYIKMGTAASTTSFTVKVGPGGFYELPQPCYTGAIYAIASAATGSARITELT